VLLVTCRSGTFVPSIVLIHDCDRSNAAPELDFHGIARKQRTFAGMNVAQFTRRREPGEKFKQNRYGE
jgi:hypothetical protein